MFVSILIPVKNDNKYLRDCIEHCFDLDYPDFEIIVLPDGPINLPYGGKVRIVPTGKVGPAKKRDMVMDEARGNILAFLDDDAFPARDWLKNALADFNDSDVAAVCGPAVTPDNDGLLQKASGLVYSSFLVSGKHSRRYAPRDICEVDDYPSSNFFVRKEVFRRIGGFDTTFWPGEDTILCLKITRALKKRIVYDPRVLVYHHRRPLFIPHLKQIKSYALHRGYFVKRFPATSLKLAYFIPSIFVLGLIGGGIISIFSPMLKFFYLGIIVIYLAGVATHSTLLSLRGGYRNSPPVIARLTKSAEAISGDCFVSRLRRLPRNDVVELLLGLAMTIKLSILILLGIILTHLTYGIYFLLGLFSKKLSDEQ